MLSLWLILAALAYPTELTQEDEKNISFIIKTLSGKSLVSLYFYQDQLEEIGEKTRPIHPLLYLGYVYSSPELQKAIPSISKFAWKRFVKDFSKSLERAKQGDAITEESIKAFAQETGRPVEALQPYIEASDWKGLFQYLDSTIKQ